MFRCKLTSVALILFSCFMKVRCSQIIPTRFIKPCQEMSQDRLTNSVRMAFPEFIRGVPNLGITSLDPFLVDKVDLTLPGLTIRFRQGVARGLRKCNVDFARMIENNLEIQLHCNLTIKGQYKSSGRLLMFPIDGDGNSTIKCRNIRINFVFELGSKLEEDGQKYLEIKKFKSHHSYDGQVVYHMTNLIQGNPEISKMVLEFMNRNWRMIAEEFGTPIVDFGVTSVLKNIERLFKMVPLHQLINGSILSLINTN